ncbi:GAF domain-containing protein, partial [Candidatus Curtissbacteria bacterium]|nr:GAF domain-containing protein [Candidatus Curtissbacteria bacterium]
MDFTTTTIAITTVSALSAIIGYFLMRVKFVHELKTSKKREEELARRAYETAMLKEIGDRIGYSLDAAKIVEIISGSLGKLLPYSTVCYMIFDEKREKIPFACMVNEPVSSGFVKDVKNKMLVASSEMAQKTFSENEIDESIAGTILDEESKEPIRSFFNLPIVISDKLVGIINVSSTKQDLYNDENTEVLFRISRLASEAASRLQEVLESEKSRLLQAVQSLSDGLLMVDTKYHLVLVNKKLCQLLGTVSAPSLFDIANALSGNLDLRAMVEEAVASQDNLPTREIVVKEKTLQVMASRVLDRKGQK